MVHFYTQYGTRKISNNVWYNWNTKYAFKMSITVWCPEPRLLLFNFPLQCHNRDYNDEWSQNKRRSNPKYLFNLLFTLREVEYIEKTNNYFGHFQRQVILRKFKNRRFCLKMSVVNSLFRCRLKFILLFGEVSYGQPSINRLTTTVIDYHWI